MPSRSVIGRSSLALTVTSNGLIKVELYTLGIWIINLAKRVRGNSRDDRDMIDGGVRRRPVGPDWAIPPQFLVGHMVLGQMLMSARGFSVYVFDKDTPTQSNCNASCLEEWAPMLAPESAIAQGQWSILQHEGGARQWAFRARPLYTHIIDSKERSYEGGDVPGWHNVFLQRTPRPPRDFRVVDTFVGQVLAEAHGKTIYSYACIEDTADMLNCDEPASPQVYRWAMCGGGDPVRCLKTFPYVIADKGAKGNSVAWSTMDIDQRLGTALLRTHQVPSMFGPFSSGRSTLLLATGRSGTSEPMGGERTVANTMGSRQSG